MSLTERKTLIVGLGRSGASAVRLVKKHGARVAITDVRSAADLAEQLAPIASLVEQVETGGHTEKMFRWAALVVVSPGVPPALAIFEVARENGAEIIGEIELAYRYLGCPMIGITGTNGKSTVTELLGAMVRAAGFNAFVGGNLGTPLAEAALAEEPYDLAVVELSSFQLEAVRTMRAVVGALLNVEPDHMNRYDSFPDYVRAKTNLFAGQLPTDAAVFNARDEQVMAQIRRVKSRLFTFGTSQSNAWTEGDTLYLRGQKFDDAIDIGEFSLPGDHNRLNLQAAALMARLVGADPAAIELAASTFTGLAHRIEELGERDGVLFINDSKATAAASVRIALAAMQRPVVLILGGRDKGADWAELEYGLLPKVRAVVAYGEAAAKIQQTMTMVPVHVVGPFGEALQAAANLARPGEAVLLSPGCASFDQFRNFEERGDAMREWLAKR